METYITKEHIESLIKEFDILTYSASECGLDTFLKWREYYKSDFIEGSDLDKFDIVSQVEMFDSDLTSMYHK